MKGGSNQRKLLLVTASSPEIKAARRSRVLNFQQITMPYLAALVPPDWEVIHVDEAIERADTAIDVDLVGITFHTPSAFHVYRLADEYRGRKIPVVLGGPHVTLMPDEAESHADAIFVGEAEETLPDFFRDFAQGTVRRRYEAQEVPSLDAAPMARQSLYHRRDLTAGRLFATRGCAFACEFCSLVVMYRRKLRRRPIADVAAEFASFPGKAIIFWDDNIALDRTYAKALFRAIAPAGKWWSSQASIHAGMDDEFLALAAASGCKQLFIGFESISQESMQGARKDFNVVEQYGEAIARIHAHGIAVQAGIVFGFDEDGEDVFERTLDFLEQAGVQNATFNMLTPYPGTALYKRLEAEGRILTHDWSKYNARADVVFQPKRMSAAALLEGYRYANRRFYSLRSIARRLSRAPVGVWWTAPLNLAYAVAWRRAGA